MCCVHSLSTLRDREGHRADESFEGSFEKAVSQLDRLPEDMLGHFLALKCSPAGSSARELLLSSIQFGRRIDVFRFCNYALCASLATHITPFQSSTRGSEAVLLALARERQAYVRDMFGPVDDSVDEFGPAIKLSFPGHHVEMVARCISNRDPSFTDAVESFLA